MTQRTIMSIASEINTLSDFILRPYLYDRHGVRLCDFGYKHGPNDVSVAVIDGEHHCQMCLDEKMKEERRDVG